jgi:hypothetical protein
MVTGRSPGKNPSVGRTIRTAVRAACPGIPSVGPCPAATTSLQTLSFPYSGTFEAFQAAHEHGYKGVTTSSQYCLVLGQRPSGNLEARQDLGLKAQYFRQGPAHVQDHGQRRERQSGPTVDDILKLIDGDTHEYPGENMIGHTGGVYYLIYRWGWKLQHALSRNRSDDEHVKSNW